MQLFWKAVQQPFLTLNTCECISLGSPALDMYFKGSLDSLQCPRTAKEPLLMTADSMNNLQVHDQELSKQSNIHKIPNSNENE